jgi:hypothetical protein
MSAVVLRLECLVFLGNGAQGPAGPQGPEGPQGTPGGAGGYLCVAGGLGGAGAVLITF